MTESEIVEILDDIWTFGHEPTDKERLAANKAIDLIQELQQYRAIGTVEECRKAVEKQKEKKLVLDSCEEKTHYKCHCGHVFMTAYSDGYRMGNQPKYCECCGQAIDWSEVN